MNAEFQRIARRDKKAFLSEQYKKIEENNRMGKARDRFKKIGDTKGTFLALEYPGGSDSKVSAYNAGDQGLISGMGRFPWRRKWEHTPVLFPGKSHGWRTLVSYSPWGCRVRNDSPTSLLF